MHDHYQAKTFQLTESEKEQLQQELGNLLKENMLLKQSLKLQSEQAISAKEELFLELLEIFDGLEFFLNYLEANPDPDSSSKVWQRLPKSLNTIQKKLLNILAKRQVQPIKLKTQQPDYSLCQVVDHEERTDLAEQTITKVVRQGFKLESKLLRPTEVIIAKKPR